MSSDVFESMKGVSGESSTEVKCSGNRKAIRSMIRITYIGAKYIPKETCCSRESLESDYRSKFPLDAPRPCLARCNFL